MDGRPHSAHRVNQNQKNPKERSPQTWAIWFILMGLFMGELLFYTWCRVQSVQVNYEITQAAENHQQQTAVQENLKIELAHLKSPQRIATIAKSQLGLIAPAPEQVVVIP